MSRNPFRWLGKNFRTLILAFLLAVVVWVSSVVADDPNEANMYPRPVELEIAGLDPNLLVVSPLADQVRVTIKAPRSIWNELNSDSDFVHTWIDLSGLKKGEHIVPVKVQVRLNPHQVVSVDPAEVKIALEPVKNNTFPIRLTVIGDPALGYQKGRSIIAPAQVAVSGPETRMSMVKNIVAQLDIHGSSETVNRNIPVQAVDETGEVVNGVTIMPQMISVTQFITLLGGYRNVVVKVTTAGRVADGYWLTNITVTPPNVTVFSSDPELVDVLPGFVETKSVDLEGLSDDVDIRSDLNLPAGVTMAGEESVLVRLSIAAIEGSLPVALPVEIIGLPPNLDFAVSPDQVDVLITGPLPILNSLDPNGIRVSINLSGLGAGVHQVVPQVDLLPEQVKVASILPESVQVTIGQLFTPIPTPVVKTPTAILTPSRTPTP